MYHYNNQDGYTIKSNNLIFENTTFVTKPYPFIKTYAFIRRLNPLTTWDQADMNPQLIPLW